MNLMGRGGKVASRFMALLEHQSWAASSKPEEFLHIIALQDCPQRLAFKSSVTHRVCYFSPEPLEEGDHPRYLNEAVRELDQQEVVPYSVRHLSRGTNGTPKKQRRRPLFSQPPRKPKPFVRVPLVAFLVSNEIDPASYTVQPHPGSNGDMAATLTLQTEMGKLEIHNVYNPERMNVIDRRMRLHTDSLRTTACPATNDMARLSLLLGDFNLHHPLWEPGCVNPLCRARDFARAMDESRMRLITEPGFPTWRQRQKQSTIDLMFASQGLAPHVPREEWGMIHIREFDSDHCLLGATINTRPSQLTSRRFLWKLDKDTWDRLRADVKEKLDEVPLEPLPDPESVDRYAERVSEILSAAILRQIPTLDPVIKPRFGSSRKRAGHFVSLTPARRKRRFRKFIACFGPKSASLWRLSRQSETWRKPRRLPQMPPLAEEVDGARASVPRGREGESFLRSIHGPRLGGLGEASHPRTPEELQFKNFDESTRELRPGEVRDVVKGLKMRKAVGIGVIANEALLACKGIIVPPLEHLFSACLRLSYYPKNFKLSQTIAIQKPGKGSYADPKSWRPIALVGAVAKILDKLVANRLTTFATETACLPTHQFAVSGKSTTAALQFLLNNVYTGWSVGDKVTLLGLDITGAYPRTNRNRLLESLAERGVPRWIVEFVYSWLCDTMTELALPGRPRHRYYINLGIPQGSSLSPILFLFFASGLLEIDVQDCGAYHVVMFSYVDDTYILVRSKSFEENCDALKILHDRVLAWAAANHVEFAPHKYGLLHFERGTPKEGRCMLVPPIEGLTAKHVKPPKGYNVPHLKILGVMVDTQLKWGPHIDLIDTKVSARRHNFKVISHSQMGPPLLQMRQLYMAKIMPIFAYGCGAWYIPHETIQDGILQDDVKVQRRIVKTYLHRLVQLHREFLKGIAGGIQGTAGEVILKELHIPPIKIFLDKTATVQRARELDTPQHLELVRTREEAWGERKLSLMKLHPYHHLDELARDLLEEALEGTQQQGNDAIPNPVLTPKARATRMRKVKEVASQRAEAASLEAWEKYKAQYMADHSGHIPEAQLDAEGWGPHNQARYARLPRHQGSLLFCCRTEAIGLNAHLHRIRAKGIESADCDCGEGPQTVAHLFMYCPRLEHARNVELLLQVGTTHAGALLRDHCAVASAFAVRHFGLIQDPALRAQVYLPGDEDGKGGGKGKKRKKEQQNGDGAGKKQKKKPRQ